MRRFAAALLPRLLQCEFFKASYIIFLANKYRDSCIRPPGGGGVLYVSSSGGPVVGGVRGPGLKAIFGLSAAAAATRLTMTAK